MGRIFISAGHGGIENGKMDPGSIVAGTSEAQQMILLRDAIVPELRSKNVEVLSVPDSLSAQGSIDWINSRYRRGDVALEIHANSFSNPSVRGATVYYISGNDERKKNAELLLLNLVRRVPQLPSRGVKADTNAGTGKLTFCRQLVAPSLLMEVCFLSNPDDRSLLLNNRKGIAQGIADGLMAWSEEISGVTNTTTNTAYPEINIVMNNQAYLEKGVLISSNAYIPVDLVDRLSIDITKHPEIRLVQYKGVVYVKAIELRDYNISVSWEASTRTVLLKTFLQVCPGQFDKIMGNGHTTEVQLRLFLKANNEKAVTDFPDLPLLYREEGSIEGVNYDIAFCQMCVETDFLRFSSDLKMSQNNFAGLGSVGGGSKSATFPSARLGVRAQIQHLKAYASLEPLVQENVDPRFGFVTRGVAPLISQLSGRWSANLDYGQRILAMLRRLYESANLL